MEAQNIQNKLQGRVSKIQTKLAEIVQLRHSKLEWHPPGKVTPRQGHDDEYEFDVPTWKFTECPLSNTKKRHTCDILIKGKIIVRKQNAELHLVHYNTLICWVSWNPCTKDPIVRDGFHFDMDTQNRCNHPIFHAQRSPDKVASKFDINTKMKGFQTLRIPTAQLDFFPRSR